MVYNAETARIGTDLPINDSHAFISMFSVCKPVVLCLTYNFMSRYFAVIHTLESLCWGKYISEKLFDHSPLILH